MQTKPYATCGARRAVFAACLLALGILSAACSRQRPRFFEYRNDADGSVGKINLDRVSVIVPRIKAGVFEGALDQATIDGVLGSIRNGEYSMFRVEAVILFDDHAVTLYQSAFFDRRKNPPTPAQIRDMREGLQKALTRYASL